MKRTYEILWGKEGPPEGSPKYVFVNEPRSQPAATHWIWWGEGYLTWNEPQLRGKWLPCDQTAEIPVRRVQ